MKIQTYFTPYIRKAIVHIIVLLIFLKLLIIFAPDFPARRWNLYTTLTFIIAFYMHTLLFIPILVKRKKLKKYLLLTGSCFFIFTIGLLWLEAIRSSAITIHFDKTPSSPFDFFRQQKWVFQGIIYFSLGFIPFWVLSFLYYILGVDSSSIKSFFSLKYAEFFINIILVLSILIWVFYLDNFHFDLMILTILTLYVLVFYLNAFVITPVLIKGKNIQKYSTQLVILTAGFFFLFTIIFLSSNRKPQLLFNALTEIGFFFFIICILSFIYGYVRIRIQKKEQLFSQKLHAKNTELNLLKSQINPHFLFNSLNTLYATSLEENASKTAKSIAKLASLIRYMQEDIQKDFIPLNNEIKYLEDYIVIQKLRCSVEPTVITEFKNTEHQNISPGLFIPFVENAFKYGINPAQESTLSISIVCDEANIYFTCTNTVDENLKTYAKEAGFGIGIKNTQKRLELVYPKNHSFEIIKENNTFSVKLSIHTKEQ